MPDAASQQTAKKEPEGSQKPFLTARIDDLKNFWNNAGIVRAWREHPGERPKHVGASLLRGFITVLGFGGALKAWQEHPPRKRSKQVWKRIGGALADRITGRIVINFLRIGVVMVLASLLGGGILAVAAIFALARGTSAALYDYSKNFLLDKISAKKTGEKAHFLSLSRLGGAGLSFAGNAVGGAVGGAALGWAVQTPLARAAFSPLREALQDSGLKKEFNATGLPQSSPLDPLLEEPTPQAAKSPGL
jgi:hypothetical protein